MLKKKTIIVIVSVVLAIIGMLIIKNHLDNKPNDVNVDTQVQNIQKKLKKKMTGSDVLELIFKEYYPNYKKTTEEEYQRKSAKGEGRDDNYYYIIINPNPKKKPIKKDNLDEIVLLTEGKDVIVPISIGFSDYSNINLLNNKDGEILEMYKELRTPNYDDHTIAYNKTLKDKQVKFTFVADKTNDKKKTNGVPYYDDPLWQEKTYAIFKQLDFSDVDITWG